MALMRGVLATFFSIALLSVGSASADGVTIRVEQYLSTKRPDFVEFNKLYVSGVTDGLIAYNAMLPIELRSFCIPEKMALTTEQADSFIRRWLAEHPKTANDTPISLVLWFALGDVFACPKQ